MVTTQSVEQEYVVNLFNTMINKIIENIIYDELTTFLQSYTENLKNNLRSEDKVNSGELYNSIMFEVNGMVGTVSMVEYGHWVDQGRRPGKFPPVNKIREWVEQRGLQLHNSSASLETQRDQLTYLVGRKIATEGIEPTNFIEDPDVRDLELRITTRTENEIAQYIESL